MRRTLTLLALTATLAACGASANTAATTTTTAERATTTTTRPPAPFAVTVDEFIASWNTLGRLPLGDEYTELTSHSPTEGWYGGPVNRDLALYAHADTPAHQATALAVLYDTHGAEQFQTPVRTFASAAAQLVPPESKISFLDAFNADLVSAFDEVSPTPRTAQAGGYMTMTTFILADRLVATFTVAAPSNPSAWRDTIATDLDGV